MSRIPQIRPDLVLFQAESWERPRAMRPDRTPRADQSLTSLNPRQRFEEGADHRLTKANWIPCGKKGIAMDAMLATLHLTTAHLLSSGLFFFGPLSFLPHDGDRTRLLTEFPKGLDEYGVFYFFSSLTLHTLSAHGAHGGFSFVLSLPGASAFLLGRLEFSFLLRCGYADRVRAILSPFSCCHHEKIHVRKARACFLRSP